ncbi:hypothetical protein K8Z61_10995 [Nocardioides sp. TRM66260-LWL]|uniref:hypothetical protein n=1 Tax=Nocardioides sp. TRM66260-LWL TaxID=2874478 RepID=UPI001CC54704|nr:hypothetical protein [Nocardioides sp. TRM66260-LWL]MBZ5735025.1 hypothetical protein [Nocardioides sp. TRM66260-LWL]
MSLPILVEADARGLVDLYAQRRAATAALAANPRPTREDVDAVLAIGDRLDAATEAFRRRHYPRRHRVVVAGYCVLTASRTLRSTELLLDLSHEYLTSGLDEDVKP